MTTLSLPNLRTHIRNMLGDPGSNRYTNSHIDEALRRALQDFSQVIPNITSGSITLTTAGRTQDLSALSGLRTILAVQYPYDPADTEANYHDEYYFRVSSGSPMITIQGSNIPHIGDSISFTYTTAHSVETLDSAVINTVPTHYETVLVTGAAGYAAIFRSSYVSEAFGSRASDMNQLLSWGNQLMVNFRAMLDECRTTPLTQQRLPGQWKLDQWDT
jgi:hypothetical protein